MYKVLLLLVLLLASSPFSVLVRRQYQEYRKDHTCKYVGLDIMTYQFKMTS